MCSQIREFSEWEPISFAFFRLIHHIKADEVPSVMIGKIKLNTVHKNRFNRFL